MELALPLVVFVVAALVAGLVLRIPRFGLPVFIIGLLAAAVFAFGPEADPGSGEERYSDAMFSLLIKLPLFAGVFLAGLVQLVRRLRKSNASGNS